MVVLCYVFFFKQKTAYEMRISDWSSDVCSSDLFDKLTYAGNPASLTTIAGSPLYHFVEGDIGDTRLVADLLGAMRPDAIMHLAAESHVDRSIDRKSTRLNSSH